MSTDKRFKFGANNSLLQKQRKFVGLGPPYIGEFAHMFHSSSDGKEMVILNGKNQKSGIKNDENNVLNRDPNYRSIDKNTTVLVDLDTQLSRNENVFGTIDLANNFDQAHVINEFNSKYRNTSQSRSPNFKRME